MDVERTFELGATVWDTWTAHRATVVAGAQGANRVTLLYQGCECCEDAVVAVGVENIHILAPYVAADDPG